MRKRAERGLSPTAANDGPSRSEVDSLELERALQAPQQPSFDPYLVLLGATLWVVLTTALVFTVAVIKLSRGWGA